MSNYKFFVANPVFYKGIGRIKGSFVRVGDSDEPMSEYEVYSYEAYRKHIRDDARPISDVPIQSLNKSDLDGYIQPQPYSGSDEMNTFASKGTA